MFGNCSKHKNLIHEMKLSRMNPDNACHHSVQNISSSRVLSENLNIGT
jgi:hypothetical protein